MNRRIEVIVIFVIILLLFSSPSLATIYEITAVGTVNQFSDIGMLGETVTALYIYDTLGISGEYYEVSDQWAFARYYLMDSAATAVGSVSGDLPIDPIDHIVISERPYPNSDVWTYSPTTGLNSIRFWNYDSSQFSRPMSPSLDDVHDIFFPQANNPDIWSVDPSFRLTANGGRDALFLDRVSYSINISAVHVPEPATCILLFFGLVGMVGIKKQNLLIKEEA